MPFAIESGMLLRDTALGDADNFNIEAFID
jgi:hypothetical protein